MSFVKRDFSDGETSAAGLAPVNRRAASSIALAVSASHDGTRLKALRGRITCVVLARSR